MLIEEAIYGELSTDSGVTALAGTRGYPQVVPQDATLPAWAYQRISGERILAHDGVTGLARGRFQISCVASSYSGAKALAAAIRGCLDGYNGILGGVSGVDVHQARIENEYDGYGLATGQQTVRLDVNILYTEV